jgi:uncharacterized protein
MMRKSNSPLLMLGAALGASLAAWTIFQKRGHQAKARQWAENQPCTALVTGASSGIGEAFARALARQGYNLIILARREDRLRSLAAQLEKQFGVNIDVHVADLNDPDALERAAQRVEDLQDLDLLVNNAGFGMVGSFVKSDARDGMDMIRVNLAAPVRLSRAALPGMIRRGRGGIINVSSVSAFMPSPGNHTYGATKAYLNFLTEVLQMELKGTGVRVQALCPGLTYSEFQYTMKVDRSNMPGFMWLQAEDVVTDSLQGLQEDRLYVVPGLVYKVLVAFLASGAGKVLIRLVQSRPFARRILGVD